MSKAVQANKFTLSGSGTSASATSISLVTLNTPDGTAITMADFGSDIGYATLEPASSREESISFTGITGTTLTGVSRGLRFVSPFDVVAGNKKAHAGGTILVFSNTSAFYSRFVDDFNAQTIAGVKTFTSIPVLPASDPTTANQAARKAYVDTMVPLAGGTMTGALILNTSAPSTALQAASKGYVDGVAIAGAPDASTTVKGIVEEATAAEVIAGTATGATGARLFINPSTAGGLVPAGLVLPYAGTSAPSGWLLCDGSAVSRTTYATLFAITSTTYGVGDGSTTFNLPNLSSRAVVGVGTGTKVATFASRSSNVITVTGLTNKANNEFQTGVSVRYSTSGSVITGLTNNTDYFVVRVSDTTFSLASTLANAQNGTVISLSSDGSGTQTFTETFAIRALGETGGEENHAMSSTELLAHTHLYNTGSGTGGSSGSGVFNSTASTSSVGGNVAMNNMQPFLVLNHIIKV